MVPEIGRRAWRKVFISFSAPKSPNPKSPESPRALCNPGAGDLSTRPTLRFHFNDIHPHVSSLSPSLHTYMHTRLIAFGVVTAVDRCRALNGRKKGANARRRKKASIDDEQRNRAEKAHRECISVFHILRVHLPCICQCVYVLLKVSHTDVVNKSRPLLRAKNTHIKKAPDPPTNVPLVAPGDINHKLAPTVCRKIVYRVPLEHVSNVFVAVVKIDSLKSARLSHRRPHLLPHSPTQNQCVSLGICGGRAQKQNC